jgi:hypothetical protein
MLWLRGLHKYCVDVTVGIGADITWTFLWALVRIFVRILTDMDTNIDVGMVRIGKGIGVAIKWIFVDIDMDIMRIFR